MASAAAIEKKLAVLSIRWYFLLAGVAGGLVAFALPPFYGIFFCFLSFPCLLLLLDRGASIGSRCRRLSVMAGLGFCFGFGYFIVGLWWLTNALFVDIARFWWALPFALLGLPVFLAFYWGFAGFLCGLFWPKGLARVFVFALCFGLAEWLRGILWTGFPWNAIGYTAMPTPLLMQSSAVFGLYGMNFWAFFVYALPVVVFTSEKMALPLSLCVGLSLAHLGFGLYRLGRAPASIAYQNSSHWVRIVQPNLVPRAEYGATQRYSDFEKQLRLSKAPLSQGAKVADFILWPEAAVPYIFGSHSEVARAIGGFLEPQQWAVVGAIRYDGGSASNEPRYYNALKVVDYRGDIIADSDKVHLVPFGEYLPFQKWLSLFGLRAVAENVGGYSAGAQRRSVTLPNGFVYLPLICYEIIFPNEMFYEGSRPNALVNVSNDSWFGATPGIYQHFQQAQMRAVETGLPLIRAANNGISAVVDPYGRVVASLPRARAAVLDAPIPKALVPIWSRSPYLLPGLCVFLILGLGLCGIWFIKVD
ncbi:apolipoprotein N-acyltransferase [Bartonella sp. DGB2]|uniref:apolipoprotein N-acyltransferase n=1 Tax=Bartonella sp. DGB2 TaxID=3388426 RepID=UPI003990351B